MVVVVVGGGVRRGEAGEDGFVVEVGFVPLVGDVAGDIRP